MRPFKIYYENVYNLYKTAYMQLFKTIFNSIKLYLKFYFEFYQINSDFYEYYYITYESKLIIIVCFDF